MNDFLNLNEAAAKLDTTASYLRKRINDPDDPLTSVLRPFSSKSKRLVHYLTRNTVLREMHRPPGSAVKKTYAQLYDEWVAAMGTGYKQVKSKALSKRGIEANVDGIRRFWKRTGIKPDITALTPDNLQQFYATLPPDHQNRRCFFSQKDITYKAVRSFVKFLNATGHNTGFTMDDFTKVKPYRIFKAVQKTLPENKIEALIEACKNWGGTGVTSFNRELTLTILLLFTDAWLRRDEVAKLTLDDIDLKNQVLIVRGKGGHDRMVGISDRLNYQLGKWKFYYRPKKDTPNLFLNKNGSPVDGDNIYKRIKSLSRHAGIDVNPHALRGSGATLAANDENNPMPLACVSNQLGHSNLKTTQIYIRDVDTAAIRWMHKRGKRSADHQQNTERSADPVLEAAMAVLRQ